MLDRFLFIGLGGSGGKTLRVLRNELQRRLEAAHYLGGIPAAWQFLYLDVPFEQERAERRLPGPLPSESYLPLTQRGLSYGDIDAMLRHKNEEVRAQLVGWRPDPDAVPVNITKGAGQYRALGRVVAGSSMQVMVSALRAAKARLAVDRVGEELEEVSRKLGDQGAGALVHPEPLIVVVASIAGGSGAGALIDVCDILRAFGAGWDNPVAVLYTPDVFEDVPLTQRAGVSPNALATVSELLAGYWDRTPSQEAFALLRTAALSVASPKLRGPSHTFLVGQGNARVRFTTQTDVYLAVGRTLATWVTSPQVLHELKQFVIANWWLAAVPDRTRLAPELEPPFSSFGHASVGLGRDRFASYATDRLAGEAVDTVLRGHRPRPRRPEQDEGDEVILERATEEHIESFWTGIGLRKLGEDRYELLDELREGERDTARNGRFTAVETEIVEAISRGRTGGLRADDLGGIVESRVAQEGERILAGERAHDGERARHWVSEIQDRIVDATADLVATVGAPATIRILDRTVAELRNAVPALRKLATGDRRLGGAVPSPPARLAGVPRRRMIMPGNPLVPDVVGDTAERYWYEAEARLHDLAADLLDELSQNFLWPLRQAVEQARAGLEQDERGTPEQPSPVERWHQLDPAEDLSPPENEFLLEPVEEYKERFPELVRLTFGTRNQEEALRRAVAEVVARPDANGRQEAVRIHDTWSPSSRVLPTADPPRQARLRVELGADVLHRTAKGWVSQEDTAIARHISASLYDYLSELRKSDRKRHEQRLSTFRASFAKVVARSMPFSVVNPSVLSGVHDQARETVKRVTTAIPFPKDHPARQVVMDVLMEDGAMEPEDAEQLFGSESRGESRIEMTTFLASPYNPLVFSSLVGTIADDVTRWRTGSVGRSFWRWRRARPLPQFIPLPADQRHAAVRGWFTALALGQVEVTDPWSGPVRLWTPQGPRLFPFPLLEEPVVEDTDMLPSVLASLPLALLDAAGHLARLEPYWRLVDLGAGERGQGRGRSLHRELRAWITAGELPPGASLGAARPPGWASDTEPATRLKMVRGFFEHQRDVYKAQFARDAEDVERGAPVSLAWELRQDILPALEEALEELKAMCDRLRQDEHDHGR